MTADASRIGINYDESKVPPYEVPDPLVFADGDAVDRASWPRRRAEILHLFERQVYGKMPGPPATAGIALAAVRKQIALTLSGKRHSTQVELLLHLPPPRSQPAPVIAGLNFFGNHTIHPDPAIRLTDTWVRNSESLGIDDHRATEETRGTLAHRWPMKRILERGYGLATVYCGDLDPDFDDGYQNGVHPLYYEGVQSAPRADEWGSIGAWAWGLSRVCDYLVSEDDIDPCRIAVMGHSRLGKTALWAGACDRRFAMVISNNSGCGGAALSRRRFGENVEFINTTFPHWFCDNFRRYNDREAELPVDQHMLIALLAPRPVYVASAAEDLWADPRGEFLSCVHANPVYRLLGGDGLASDTMPTVDSPLQGVVSYHIRSGKHDVTGYDWERYLDFADRFLPR